MMSSRGMSYEISILAIFNLSYTILGKIQHTPFVRIEEVVLLQTPMLRRMTVPPRGIRDACAIQPPFVLRETSCSTEHAKEKFW